MNDEIVDLTPYQGCSSFEGHINRFTAKTRRAQGTPLHRPPTSAAGDLGTKLRNLVPALLFAILLAWGSSPASARDLAQDEPPADAPEGVAATSPIFFPVVFRDLQQVPVEYLPTTTALFCSSAAQAIPDQATISSTIDVGDARLIGDLDVRLEIAHGWVGDLVVSLTHQETGKTVTLVDRPGIPASEQGCGNDDLIAILDDEITSSLENKCAASPAAISGIYLPSSQLAAFDLERATGAWTLTISDLGRGDTGRLRSWCLAAKVSDSPAPEIPPPPLPILPPQARIHGISGEKQKLPLDCESRSAVDWAGYFGYSIDELAFFNGLPKSDNPDKGFVGDVNGVWGNIPPNAYGVHAEPVAELLRAYGVPAFAQRPLRWDALRAEIASGQPVFVWILGSGFNGIPEYYTPSDGLHTVVARYEHTVLVTGYSETKVTILNGATISTINIDQFLDSWSALGNMAITAP
jgi:subtilisin-like proprotein convertase family protein/uncharacterized protein YvpB